MSYKIGEIRECKVCEDFYNHYGQTERLCIICRNDKNREKTRSKRKVFYDRLRLYCVDNPCEVCGETDYTVLEFDHIDSRKKTASISTMVVQLRKWKVIEEELKKCRVLCSNCHKRRTAKQLRWYK